MNKNNKKTMNERTHNPHHVYKDNRNSNSNTNNRYENRSQEFAEDFGDNSRNAKTRDPE